MTPPVDQAVRLSESEREALRMILDHYAVASTPQSRAADQPRVIAAVERIVAFRVRAAKAEALREAADDLECPAHYRKDDQEAKAGGFLTHGGSCHACMKANWLRARADRIEADHV